MIAIDDFQQLQRKVERIRQRRDQVRGAIEQLLKRLPHEYDCPDVASARQRLVQLEKKEARYGKEYTEMKAEFEEKYQDKLGEN